MKKENKTGFGERVREIRLKLKLNQQEFAKGVGMTAPSLSEIENGKYRPGHDFFYNIARSYNVNIYYLLYGEGTMFRDPSADVPGFSGRLTELVSRNPDAHRFLYYFENSPIVQYYVLGQFRRFLSEERETIDKDIESYKKE
jgi:transcriptional regulator with XRE-family HTH domain